MGARLFALLSATAMLGAQNRLPKQPVHIDGVILEQGSRFPIVGAKLTLRATEFSDERITTSDANGRFTFDTSEPPSPLPLQIVPDVPGYLTPAPEVASSIAVSSASEMLAGIGMSVFPVRAGISNYRVELILIRTAEVRGVLVDQDSRKPIENLSITALRRVYRAGQANFNGAGKAMMTKADGSFRIEGLSPGDYALHVQGPEKISIDALSAEAKEEPLGYGIVQYPDLSTIAVLSGAAVDVGEIRLKQQRLKTVNAVFDSDCTEYDTISVSIFESVSTNGPSAASKKISCGGFRVSHVPDRFFNLTVRLVAENSAGWVSQPLDLRSTDTMHIRIQKRAPIQAAFEVEDASTDPLPDNLKDTLVDLSSKETPNFAGELIKRAAPGKIDGMVYGGAVYSLRYFQLPESYYVKRVLYNGAELPDPDSFAATPNLGLHSLRIVLSPHPATFQAQIENTSGTAPADLSVVLVRDGIDPSRQITERMVLKVDSQGRAVKRGLRPARYHAFAISASVAASLERPGELDRYVRGAKSVDLEADQSNVLSLQQP